MSSITDEKRSEPRRPIVQTGAVEIDGNKIDCYVVDLSKKGMKIRTLDIIKCQISSVKLHLDGVGTFDAEVRWIKGKEMGLLLKENLESVADQKIATIADVLRVQSTR